MKEIVNRFLFKFFVAVYLLMLVPMLAFAQSVSPDSLWHNYAGGMLAKCVLQAGGGIWVGSEGGGLLWYKASGQVVVFNKANSNLPSNNIYALCLDSAGSIWAGSSHGLVKIMPLSNPQQWPVYTHHNTPLGTVRVRSLACDQLGSIWAGTENGLLTNQGGHWTAYTENNSGLPGNYVRGIGIAPDTTVWLATVGGGLANIKNQIWSIVSPQNSALTSGFTTDVKAETNGTIWATTSNAGILRISPTGNINVFTFLNSNLTANIFVSIYIDKQNNKYFCTYNGGIEKYNDSTWVRISPSGHGPDNEAITAMAIDSAGNLWATGFSNGLWRMGINQTDSLNPGNINFKNNQTQTVLPTDSGFWLAGHDLAFVANTKPTTTKHILPGRNHYLTDLCLGPNGSVWAATGEEGIWVFEPTQAQWQKHTPAYAGVNYAQVTALYADTAQNRYWVACRNINNLAQAALFGYGNTDTLVYTGNSLPMYPIIDMLRTHPDTLWLATAGSGLYFMASQQINNNPLLPGHTLNSLAFSKNQQLWVATPQGLAYRTSALNFGWLTPFNSPMPSAFCAQVATDTNGAVWATTKAGLIRYHNGSFTNFNSENAPLPSNLLTCLAIDNKGIKYIGTDKDGLATFAGDTLPQTITATHPKTHTTQHTNIQLWPNPANQHLSLRINSTLQTQGQLKTFDLNGRLLTQQSMATNQNITLPLTHLPKGVYVAIWQSNLQTTPLIKRFIIAR